ncbi:MAG: type II CAAX endopeptidase family protein [Acidobacteriota bacterium]
MNPSPPSPAEIDQPPELGPSHWGYGETLFVAGFAVFSVLVLNLITLLGHKAYTLVFDQTPDLEKGPLALTAAVLMQAVWWTLILGCVYVTVVHKHGWKFSDALAWKPFRAPWTLFVSAGFGLAFSVAALSSLVDIPEDTPFEQLISSRSALLAFGIFGVLVASPVEELLFRGFLYPVFERAHGALIAIAATAALFTLPHAQQYGNHWQILLAIFWVGVALGWIRQSTGSTIPSPSPTPPITSRCSAVSGSSTTT